MTDVMVTRQENKAVIQPTGNVVAASVGALRSTMRGIVGDGVQEVVMDLTNVQMVDSTGIGLLISAHNSLRRTGGRLAVIHASPEVLDLLMTMRIHQHFSVSGA